MIRRVPHAFGDQLQLHHNKGCLQVSSCTVGIIQGSVTGYKDMSNLSYSSGVSTASCGMKLDTVSFSSATEPTLALITGRCRVLGELYEMSRFTHGFLAAVLEEGSVEPCLIHQTFQYLVAQSASLKATVCMMVSIGSSQIDTPWSYIKSHGAVTDRKSESLGARDKAVEMFLVP